MTVLRLDEGLPTQQQKQAARYLALAKELAWTARQFAGETSMTHRIMRLRVLKKENDADPTRVQCYFLDGNTTRLVQASGTSVDAAIAKAQQNFAARWRAPTS